MSLEVFFFPFSQIPVSLLWRSWCTQAHRTQDQWLGAFNNRCNLGPEAGLRILWRGKSVQLLRRSWIEMHQLINAERVAEWVALCLQRRYCED
jgi:hypothetical protein